MKNKLGHIIVVIVIICIIVFCLIYTRPRTIEQRYPYLDISKCTRIEGSYTEGANSDHISFAIDPGAEHFNELIETIRSTKFNTRLKNILPKGTRIHHYTEGDINWEIECCFDSVTLPDGSTSSGSILGIQNFFGDLTITVNGEIVSCSVENEKQWAQKIMDIITQYKTK